MACGRNRIVSVVGGFPRSALLLINRRAADLGWVLIHIPQTESRVPRPCVLCKGGKRRGRPNAGFSGKVQTAFTLNTRGRKQCLSYPFDLAQRWLFASQRTGTLCVSGASKDQDPKTRPRVSALSPVGAIPYDS